MTIDDVAKGMRRFAAEPGAKGGRVPDRTLVSFR
jgi:hypothetical protein